jgi:integrase
LAGRRRFTVRRVQALTDPGRYCDGAGLWLQVSPTATKSWIFRYQLDGRARHMGLGPYPEVTLSEARDAALEARRLLIQGVDPIEARNAERRAARTRAKGAVSFAEAAGQYIADHRDDWKNQKHAAQWTSSLQAYAHPTLGSMDVRTITVADLMRVLRPIWLEKHETASRLRGRIERILDWCSTMGYGAGQNAARWRGNLDHLLPRRSTRRRVRHHPALPWHEVPAFMARLRDLDGRGAQALEFIILTAGRSGEVRGATRSEFDLNRARWTIPAERMKGEREHRVPLSMQAVKLLQSLPPLSGSPYLFWAPRGGMLSDMTISAVCRRMGVEAVPHGFRSSFRDWCAEATNFPREVAEQALAHANPDRVEAAYFRSDLFEKRRVLMAEWATFCDGNEQ